jgi:hypothetical protein
LIVIDMDTPQQTITITEAPPVNAVPPSMPRLAVRFAIGLVQLSVEQVVSTLRQAQGGDGRTHTRASRPGRGAGSLARLRVVAAEEQLEGRALALRAWRRLVRMAAGELANSPDRAADPAPAAGASLTWAR